VIVVFGSINVDLVARVARMPHPGETLAGESFSVHAGGKGANQALAARRAGAPVALVGAVGDDTFAAMALGGLADAGVDLTRVRRVNAATGVGMIHVDAQGENSITIVAGANALAVSADVPDTLLVPGTTVLLQLEVPLPAIVELAARAHARGARVILNAAPWCPLPLPLYSSLDVLVANAIEAAAVARALDLPAAPDDFAAAFHRRLGCAAVVTLGAQGALAAADGKSMRARTPAVDVVDTTGAGDAFTGVLAAALDRGLPWDRALAHGVCAGSLACTAAGAQTAFPGAATIEKVAATVESELFAAPTD